MGRAGMSGLDRRHKVAGVAAVVWPAVRLLETITHPSWGYLLSDILAPLVAVVFLCLIVTRPAAGRQPQARHARQPVLVTELVTILTGHVARLSLRVGGMESRMDRSDARQDRGEAKLGRCEKRTGYLFRAMADTSAEAGYSAPDHDDTQPKGLRVVRLACRNRPG